MKTATLAHLFFLWLTVLVLIQPIISHQDYMLDVYVKATAEYAAQKAAPDGYVSPSLQQELLDNLAAVGFDPNQVVIETQFGMSERGERLDVVIRAPRMPMYLYRFSDSQVPTEHFAHSYTTSEYIP